MKRILIADDSLFMRKILRDILSKDYEIVEADTGKKALKQFKNKKPDLTLLDIVMSESEEEGLKVLEEIKKIDSQACVVMVTAIGQKNIVDKCKKLGAQDIIIKPFRGKEILEIVEKYLSSV